MPSGPGGGCGPGPLDPVATEARHPTRLGVDEPVSRGCAALFRSSPHPSGLTAMLEVPGASTSPRRIEILPSLKDRHIAHAATAPASASRVSVPASRLQEFEPTALGALRPRFRRLLARIHGESQSTIRRLLIEEAADVEHRGGGTDQLAYEPVCWFCATTSRAVTTRLSVAGRCYLAPIFESPGLTPRSDEIRAHPSLPDRSRPRTRRAGDLPWIERAATPFRSLRTTPSASWRCWRRAHLESILSVPSRTTGSWTPVGSGGRYGHVVDGCRSLRPG